MAARNPTDWNRFVDQRKFTSGKEILAAETSKVYDDQVYCLDAAQLGISDGWFPFRTQEATFIPVAIYDLVLKDMCSVAGVTTDGIAATWAVLAYNTDDAATAGEVKLTSTAAASNSTTIAIAIGRTSAASPWGAAYSAINIITNGTEEKLTLSVRRTAGTGWIYVAGLFLRVDET